MLFQNYHTLLCCYLMLILVKKMLTDVVDEGLNWQCVNSAIRQCVNGAMEHG